MNVKQHAFGQSADSSPVIIGKVGSMATLFYKIQEGDTVYSLKYADRQHIWKNVYDTLFFDGKSDEVDSLYRAIKSVFTRKNRKKKKYTFSIKLGKYDLYFASLRGVIYSCQAGPCESYFQLTEGQVDKLFGKKNRTK